MLLANEGDVEGGHDHGMQQLGLVCFVFCFLFRKGTKLEMWKLTSLIMLCYLSCTLELLLRFWVWIYWGFSFL